jgi:hypothetical protein
VNNDDKVDDFMGMSPKERDGFRMTKNSDEMALEEWSELEAR